MVHKPSPRPSIHSSAQNEDASNSPHSSPKLPRRNIPQRNSDNERNDTSSSDENEDEIVPSPLTPSQKYCEESFYTTRNSFDRSCNSNSDSSYTARDKASPSPTFFQTESYQGEYKNKTCATKSNPLQIAALMIIVLGIILAYSLVAIGGTTEDEIPIRKNCSFDDLKLRFKKEDDYLWKSLQAGTEKNLNDNNASPGVYLFLHADNLSTRKLIHEIVSQTAFCFDPTLKPLNLESKDFTSNEDYGIVVEKYKNEIKEGGVLLIVNLNEIPGEAARALHSICDTYTPIVNRVMIFMTLVVSEKENAEDPTLKPLNLESKDFTSNEDYGIVVEKYKNEIKEGGVLLIVNLNEIPGEAARALHSICDTYTPIVNRVMIFMTLVVSEKENAEENEIELAERTLMELWGSKLKRSELDPLITRVTDQVFRLKSG